MSQIYNLFKQKIYYVNNIDIHYYGCIKKASRKEDNKLIKKDKKRNEITLSWFEVMQMLFIHQDRVNLEPFNYLRW